MLRYTSGDILTADTEAIVNPVNCVGVMGRGLALQFRKAYPGNFTAYKQACVHGMLRPGALLVHDLVPHINPRYIINFPTKQHWKDKSSIADIELGLEALVTEVIRRHISSIAIPALGCGLGGLEWSKVRPRIEAAFIQQTTVRVLIYDPTAGTVQPM